MYTLSEMTTIISNCNTVRCLKNVKQYLVDNKRNYKPYTFYGIQGMISNRERVIRSVKQY